MANPSAPDAGKGKEKLSTYVDKNGDHTEDAAIDGMSEDSFPASDPPPMSISHTGSPKNRKGKPTTH